MNEFSIIHAADLHLGAPFKGISQTEGFPPQMKKRLLSAASEAWSRLVDLCIRKKPLALLLAGDLYNPEGCGLSSLNQLREGCARLNEQGTAVLMVHGNHDPAETIPPWSWPENVHIFGSKQPEAVPINRLKGRALPGAPLDLNRVSETDFADCKLVVFGISHQKERVTENLAVMVRQHAEAASRVIPAQMPCAGLLHCAVGERASRGEMPYAPCSISDLRTSALDYWALGHIHKRGQAGGEPPAWYSGNIQGLNIKETGPKGCLEISFDRLKQTDVKFHSLAPLQWLQLTHTVKPETSVNQLQMELLGEIECRFAELRPTGVEGLLVRLTLAGQTALHSWLRANSVSLKEELLSRLPCGHEFVCIKDMFIETSPLADIEGLSRENSLLGETLREIAAAAGLDEQELAGLLLGSAQTPLGRLYESAPVRKSGLSAPDYQEMQNLLRETAMTCIELLHNGGTGGNNPADTAHHNNSRPQLPDAE
ncbi:MAG: metallophosphoesterase [Desulfovibrionaceae bacterium]|nr:metallophosphoesterase [Desulfovibrionaceae bacterium]